MGFGFGSAPPNPKMTDLKNATTTSSFTVTVASPRFPFVASLTLPGTSPSYTSTVIGNTVYTHQTGGSDPVDIPLTCSTNFTVVNGIVKSWQFQGNNCVSR